MAPVLVSRAKNELPMPVLQNWTPASPASAFTAIGWANGFRAITASSRAISVRIVFVYRSMRMCVSNQSNSIPIFHDRPLHHQIRPGGEPEGAGEGVE